MNTTNIIVSVIAALGIAASAAVAGGAADQLGNAPWKSGLIPFGTPAVVTNPAADEGMPLQLPDLDHLFLGV